MVRFSCFSTAPANRSKKATQHSIGTQDQSIKFVTGSVKSNPMLDDYNSSCNSAEQSTSFYSQQDCWRLDGLNVKLPEDNQEILQTALIKKSHSLGNIMEKESGYSDDDIDLEFSLNLLNGLNMKEARESSDNTNFTVNFHPENDGQNYQNQPKENDLIKSFDDLTDPMHHESLFSIEVLKQPDGDWRADIVEQAADDVADSGYSSQNIPILSRSYSVTNHRVNLAGSCKNAVSHRDVFRRSRSFSDLNNFNMLETELQNGEKSFDSGGTVVKNTLVSYSNMMLHPDVNRKVPYYDDTNEGGHSLLRSNIIKDHASDGKCLSFKLGMNNKAACNSQCNPNFANVLKKPEAKDAEFRRECQHESSHYWDQLTPQEFNMRRVEHWISQIDIHGDLIVEDHEESSTSVSKEEPQFFIGMDPPKPDTRSSLAMEVAYNYISSLTSSSSSAQMSNLGLVAVPVLSPFVSLRVLNFSGNTIVRLTPGSLPKGLHMLNLSKNNISTIEGLRDLSRLRVLDLNYNRIARIGHGLSSCTSLKELYLAGNKISEVEGLHRLLKLNTLDLRFNRISTSKGLSQLAANYVSLQAINLEGNPSQKNVGDEQLKKFLLGLLPNLLYYNKQAIRMGSKDVSGHTARVVTSPPQFDRGGGAEPKFSLRGSHGSGLHQLGLNDDRKVIAIAPSRSKDRHVRLQLPPASTKLTKLRSDNGKKPLDLNTSDAMKRSRSASAFFHL